MRILDANIMKHLSFPDFSVENMIFLPQEKSLRIIVENAWLDVDEGILLGKGVLFFSDWEKISIRSFDHTTEQWSFIPETSGESLKDLCEASFTDSSVCLSGFGKNTNQWMEWTIEKVKMHAEFENGKR